jgi:hypothetical protein
VALYAQLCRTMGFSPYGTLRKDDHEQVLRMKSGEKAYFEVCGILFFHLSK